jgi:hypothetical protein
VGISCNAIFQVRLHVLVQYVRQWSVSALDCDSGCLSAYGLLQHLLKLDNG